MATDELTQAFHRVLVNSDGYADTDADALTSWVRSPEGRAVVARALGLEWAEDMRRDNIEKARGSGFTD